MRSEIGFKAAETREWGMFIDQSTKERGFSYTGSFSNKARAGEFGGIFSIFTGCFFTQDR
jgi:hypothetical protein